MQDLTNKKILLVGASGGIGVAVAPVLSQLGAKLILVGRDEERLKHVFDSLAGNGHQVRCFDVRQTGDVASFMKSCVQGGEKLNGLVYLATLKANVPFRVQTIEHLEEMMRVNFYGFVEMVKQFVKKQISENGSSIVTFSSYAALNPGKSQLAYGASKAAIDNSVVIMARELEKRKIRVNSIRPGHVQWGDRTFEEIVAISGSLVGNETSELIKMQGGEIPPGQIARLVAFLLSDDSLFINGENIDIKGLL